MIKEEWQQIKENQDVRQNLSRLRQEIKDKDLRRRFSELIRGEEFLLTERPDGGNSNPSFYRLERIL